MYVVALLSLICAVLRLFPFPLSSWKAILSVRTAPALEVAAKTQPRFGGAFRKELCDASCLALRVRRILLTSFSL